MIANANLPASLRLIDLDLASLVHKIAAGQKLPVVEQFIKPRAGGLCEQIISALDARAESDEDRDLFAEHTLSLFKGGEQKIEFDDSVSGQQVFIVLDFPPLDETKVSSEFFTLASATLLNNYLQLAKMTAEAARGGGGAAEVHLLMPNHAYARQDQRHGERGPITAAIIARDLAPYFDSVTCLHLHAAQVEGMHSVLGTRFRNISPHEIHGPGFVCRDPDTLHPISWRDVTAEGAAKLFSRVCIASPDAGGAKTARSFAKYCKKLATALINENAVDGAERQSSSSLPDIPLIVVDKSRPSANVSEVVNVLGVERAIGRHCTIFDDMGDGLGTMKGAAEALLDAGAASVEGTFSHGYFSEGALPLLDKSRIRQVNVADGMALRPSVLQHPKVRVTPIAPAFAQVIIDIATLPTPNIRFRDRHTHDRQFRKDVGRFAGPMLGN